MRPLRELRPWILVSGASACFGLVAGAVTWAGAVQRRAAWAAVAPVLYQEQVDELARLRQLHPTLNYDLDQLTVLNTVPEPATVLLPMVAALGSLMLILEITLLLAPQTLVPAGSTVTEAAPTAIVLLTLSCCAAVAGCAGSPRRAAARATAPTLLGATACAAAWLVYHRHNPLPPLGWEFAEVVPMHWLGTWQLTTLVVSAAGIGVAANAATRALTARPGTGLATARHSARAATQP